MSDSVPQSIPRSNPTPDKRCSRCHLWLPFSCFGPSRRTVDGLYVYCNKCLSIYTKETMTSAKRRDRNLHTNYGITAKQYDRMFAEQGGVCACCGQSETRLDSRTGEVRYLSVDHDHDTGDVRSLLCGECNSAFGMMQEDPDRIRMLLAYAEKIKSREPSKKIVQHKLVD